MIMLLTEIVAASGVAVPDDTENYEDDPEPPPLSFNKFFASLNVCRSYLLQHGMHNEYVQYGCYS